MGNLIRANTNPVLLLIAFLVVAGLAFAAGISGLLERQHLLKNGIETTGVVVRIDVGVRGLRSVEAQFTTTDEDVAIGRDLHKTQWFSANEIDDPVVLYYDPQSPQAILIDRGIRTWSNPAFLLFGGVLLCVLGLLVFRHTKR